MKSFLKRPAAPESLLSLRSSAPRSEREGGFTVVESMIAIAVLAIAAFAALTTLTRSSSLDETLKERSLALRAAMSKMESIAAYDYSDDITNLVTYWSQSANKAFVVEGLRAPAGTANHGAITINNADPLRIVFTVTISWLTRDGQARTLSLSETLTEIIH
jgi:prepilin-type N-terminal cleavage/methylation domain-containing protein